MAEFHLGKDFICDVPTKISNRFVAFDGELMDRALPLNVRWHPDELLGDQFDVRDWQADVHEGLESDGQVIALGLGTSHRALELPMHQVDYY